MKYVALLLPALLLATPAVLADDEGAQLKSLVEKHSESICTVKVVIRTEMGGLAPPSEATRELQGVVIDKSGLILMSNAALDQEMSGFMGLQITTTPLSFKVVFGNEEKEYSAFLATKDPELGLAFVQIEDLEGRELKPLAFNDTSKPEIGTKVASISRLGRGYDYACYFHTGRIAGKIKKPRKAYMIDGGSVGPGLPVFTTGGQLVGILTMLAPTVEESGGGGLVDMLSGLVGAGPLFVVPGRTIAAKLAPALEEASRMKAERKKAEEGASESGADEASGAATGESSDG